MKSSRKLQIFVSSTYTDLIQERQAAVEAILQAGHIPAGMELFSAGDESQWEVIRDWIDESDALLLILGERYGSVEPRTKKSYTQLEYEYAVEQGKKVIAIVLHQEWIDQKYRELGGRAVDDYRKQHKAFKKTVTDRMAAWVKDHKDIAIEVGKSLSRLAKDESLMGWIKADDYANSQALINELRRTVEELRARPVSSSSLPSYEAIKDEIDFHTKELRGINIQFMSLVGAYNVSLETDALTLTRALMAEALLNAQGPVYQHSYFQAWLQEVSPILTIWGYVNADASGPISNRFSVKGQMLKSQIESMDINFKNGIKFEAQLDTFPREIPQ